MVHSSGQAYPEGVPVAIPADRLHGILKKGRWFADLPAAIQAEVLAALRVTRFAAGEAIYRQGDAPSGLHGIVSGQINTIGLSHDGLPTLLSVLRKGEWSGFLGLVDELPHQFSITAVVTTEIAFLPKESVHRIFAAHSETLDFLVQPLCELVRFAYAFLINTNWRPPLRVVAQRLLDLGRCAYVPGASAVPVLEAISQDDISAASDLTRPTVNRALHDLAKRGLINLGYGRVEILDVPGLDLLALGQEVKQAAETAKQPAVSAWASPGLAINPPSNWRDALIAGAWFPSLSPQARDEIAQALIFRQFNAGQPVYAQGAPSLGLFLTITGQGRLVGVGRDNRTVLISLLRPGEWSGFSSVVDGGQQSLSLVPTRKTIVAMLPAVDAQAIFRADVANYRAFVVPTTRVLRYIYNYLIETNRRSPARLVSQRLYDMARSAHMPEIQPRSFVQDLTQHDLALATGLSRPTVNRVFQDLDSKGVIEIGYGKIHILDPGRLLALAQTDED